MEQTEVAAINDEPWRTGVGLDHIAKLGVSVFEAGWRMSGYGIHKQLIEVRGFKLGVASLVDLQRELENLCDIFPLYT